MITLKKRALSLALALVLLVALSAFALADEYGTVELELLADDGTVATAVLDYAYWVYNVRANVDGEEVVVDAIITPYDGTMTVDKDVSGTGYLGAGELVPGMPVPTEYTGDISTSAGEHQLMAYIDDTPNTGSPYFAYSYFEEEWGMDAVMMYDLLTYTAPDGSTVYIAPSESMFVPAGGSQSTGDVEFELLADDGTVATAVLTGSYWVYNVRANVDGEEVVVDAIITPYDGTMTVDKDVSGTGYLGAGELVPGMPVPTEYTGGISTSAGEHQLTAFVDGAVNTDSPYFAYNYFEEEWGTEATMMYDLITFTAPDGSTVCIAPSESMFAPAEPEPQVPEFTDIQDWQKAAVDFVYEKGLMNGTGSTAFSPNEPMTLGMALTVMARASGVDTSSSNPWYKAGFDWAEANNVQFSGKNTDIVERQDLITMIWMLADSPDADPSVLDSFPDASAIHDECLTAVAWSVQAGIINGTDKGLEPSISVTRAVYATILMRAYDLF